MTRTLKSNSAHKFTKAKRFHTKPEGPSVGDYEVSICDNVIVLRWQESEVEDHIEGKSRPSGGVLPYWVYL